jgi:hypothetical protein
MIASIYRLLSALPVSQALRKTAIEKLNTNDADCNSWTKTGKGTGKLRYCTSFLVAQKGSSSVARR